MLIKAHVSTKVMQANRTYDIYGTFVGVSEIDLPSGSTILRIDGDDLQNVEIGINSKGEIIVKVFDINGDIHDHIIGEV